MHYKITVSIEVDNEERASSSMQYDDETLTDEQAQDIADEMIADHFQAWLKSHGPASAASTPDAPSTARSETPIADPHTPGSR